MLDHEKLIDIKDQIENAIRILKKEKKSSISNDFINLIEKMSVFIGKPLNMMSTHLEESPYLEYLIKKIEEYARSGKSWVYTQLDNEIYIFSNKGKPLYNYGADAHVGNYLNPFEPRGDIPLAQPAIKNVKKETSTGFIYDSFLTYKKKISNDFLSCFTREAPSSHRSFEFLSENPYPCVMIGLEQTTLPFHRKLNEKDLWANMVCSFVTGICNYESFYKNESYSYGIEMHRRGGFGFNHTAIAQTKSSVRINLGFVPKEYIDLCASSVRQLDRVLCYLKYMPTKIQTAENQSIFFKNKDFKNFSSKFYEHLNALCVKGLTYTQLLYEVITPHQSEKAYDFILKSAGARDYMNSIVTQKLLSSSRPSDDALISFKNHVKQEINNECIIFLKTLYHELKLDQYDSINMFAAKCIQIVHSNLINPSLNPNDFEVELLKKISAEIGLCIQKINQSRSSNLADQLLNIKIIIDNFYRDKENKRKKKKSQISQDLILKYLTSFQKDYHKFIQNYKLKSINEKIKTAIELLKNKEIISIDSAIIELNSIKALLESVAISANLIKSMTPKIEFIDSFLIYIGKIYPLDLNIEDLKLLEALESAVIHALSHITVKDLGKDNLSLSFSTPKIKLPIISKPLLTSNDTAFFKTAQEITDEFEKNLPTLIEIHQVSSDHSLFSIIGSNIEKLNECLVEMKIAIIEKKTSTFNSKLNLFNELLFVFALLTTPLEESYQSDSDYSIESNDLLDLDALDDDEKTAQKIDSDLFPVHNLLSFSKKTIIDSENDENLETDADDELSDSEDDENSILKSDAADIDSLSQESMLAYDFKTKNSIAEGTIEESSVKSSIENAESEFSDNNEDKITLQITEKPPILIASNNTKVSHKIYAKKATVHNGMLSIFTAVSISLKMQSVENRVISSICPYYEFPEMMKQLDDFSIRSKIIPAKSSLHFSYISDLKSADIIFADLSPCFTKKAHQILNLKKTILSTNAEILIIDTTSSRKEEVKEIIHSLSRRNYPSKAVILVESGLKHGEQGADKIHYGTVRIWSKDKNYIDNFLAAIPEQFKPKTALHHHYRRMLKKLGSTTSNSYYGDASSPIQNVKDEIESTHLIAPPHKQHYSFHSAAMIPAEKMPGNMKITNIHKP